MDAATVLTTALAVAIAIVAAVGAFAYRRLHEELTIAQGGEIIAERDRDAARQELEQLKHAARQEIEQLEHELADERVIAAKMREFRAAEASSDPLEAYLGNELVVHTARPDDQTVRGTLRTVGPVWLELVDARYLGAQYPEGEAAAEGLVLVPRTRVSSTQVLDPAEDVARAPAPASDVAT